MNVFELIDILPFLHSYLLRERTGNAEEFAAKLGISRASLYRILDTLKDYGIEIGYSRERGTYYYLHRDLVKISISIAQLSEEEMKKEKEKLVLSQN